jgi:hypothetical protein
MLQLGAISQPRASLMQRSQIRSDVRGHRRTLAIDDIANGCQHSPGVTRQPCVPTPSPTAAHRIAIQSAGRVRLEIANRPTCFHDSVNDQVHMRAPYVRGKERPLAKCAGFPNRTQDKKGLAEIETGFGVSHCAPSVADERSRWLDGPTTPFPRPIHRPLFVPAQSGSIAAKRQQVNHES